MSEKKRFTVWCQGRKSPLTPNDTSETNDGKWSKWTYDLLFDDTGKLKEAKLLSVASNLNKGKHILPVKKQDISTLDKFKAFKGQFTRPVGLFFES